MFNAVFNAVLEPPKAASKPSEFGCSNTKTPIIGSDGGVDIVLGAANIVYNIIIKIYLLKQVEVFIDLF